MKTRQQFTAATISLVLIAQCISAIFPQSPAKKKNCSGAWTGVITYKRSQSNSESKTVERVSGRGKDTRDWQLKYDYSASVSVIESPEKNGSSTGKSTINHTFSSIEKNTAVERNSCDQGKTWRDMSGVFTSKTEAKGSGRQMQMLASA